MSNIVPYTAITAEEARAISKESLSGALNVDGMIRMVASTGETRVVFDAEGADVESLRSRGFDVSQRENLTAISWEVSD